MEDFNSIVFKVIARSNIVLEVLDARHIEETRNRRIEAKIGNKLLIHVINKSDYAGKDEMEKAKKQFTNCVFVSAKTYSGILMLKHKIKALAKKHNIEEPLVGVVGYPNVGKSSLINALKGHNAARTSPQAGFTRGYQNIRVGKDFMMIDSPGVFEDKPNLVLIDADNPSSIKDPDLAVAEIVEKKPEFIESYGVKISDDFEETIERLAKKFNYLKKGGVFDTDKTCRKILMDWNKGKK